MLNEYSWHKQYMAKYTIDSDDFDVSGYAEIVSTEKRIIGADACELAAATYDLDVNVDSAGNQQLSIVVPDGATWDDIAALLQTEVHELLI